ncbi:MAG: long-chain fatty acid--CoA ligase [Dehalococcoidia bacterium]
MLVHEILDHAARLYADRTAILDIDTELTYREARDRSCRLAAGLLDLGLKPGENIGILANNSHRYWETYFAASYAGLALAPLNIRLSGPELEFILGDGEIRALLVGKEYRDLVDSFRSKLPQLAHLVAVDGETGGEYTSFEELVSRSAPLASPARDWSEDDMLNLCYTGGTTGLPKGVMLSQRNVTSNALHAVIYGEFTERDTWLHVAPMFHLADAWACYSVTMVGGTHAFVPGFAPQSTLEAIQRCKVTKTILVPTMINFLVNFPGARDYDVSSLETVLFGASPMPVDRLLEAVKVFGPKLAQAYGMTETAPLLTGMKKEWTAFDGSPEDTRRLASCGREVPGVRLWVAGEDGTELPVGEVGEIVASGPNVMSGYWQRPEETAVALRGGVMHTGDLASMDKDGYVFIVDRAKDMIISGGENVFSTEVENALYEHPEVLEAAVIGVPDEQWGEAVLAVVVPKDGTQPDEQGIIEHCRGLIAGYKCPKQVVFRSDPLPKSGPGKILKTELRKPFWEGQERQVN